MPIDLMCDTGHVLTVHPTSFQLRIEVPPNLIGEVWVSRELFKTADSLLAISARCTSNIESFQISKWLLGAGEAQ